MVKRAFGWIAGVGGLVIASLAMRPSPAASVSGHASRVLLILVPAILAVTVARILLGRAGTGLVIVAAFVFAGVVLFHPVSDRIADEDVAKFETVYSLQERAAQGEPFRQMQGHWYQVKPWIARLLFF
jgi:hypothetical protein